MTNGGTVQQTGVEVQPQQVQQQNTDTPVSSLSEQELYRLSRFTTSVYGTDVQSAALRELIIRGQEGRLTETTPYIQQQLAMRGVGEAARQEQARYGRTVTSEQLRADLQEQQRLEAQQEAYETSQRKFTPTPSERAGSFLSRLPTVVQQYRPTVGGVPLEGEISSPGLAAGVTSQRPVEGGFSSVPFQREVTVSEAPYSPYVPASFEKQEELEKPEVFGAGATQLSENLIYGAAPFLRPTTQSDLTGPELPGALGGVLADVGRGVVVGTLLIPGSIIDIGVTLRQPGGVGRLAAGIAQTRFTPFTAGTLLPVLGSPKVFSGFKAGLTAPLREGTIAAKMVSSGRGAVAGVRRGVGIAGEAIGEVASTTGRAAEYSISKRLVGMEFPDLGTSIRAPGRVSGAMEVAAWRYGEFKRAAGETSASIRGRIGVTLQGIGMESSAIGSDLSATARRLVEQIRVNAPKTPAAIAQAVDVARFEAGQLGRATQEAGLTAKAAVGQAGQETLLAAQREAASISRKLPEFPQIRFPWQRPGMKPLSTVEPYSAPSDAPLNVPEGFQVRYTEQGAIVEPVSRFDALMRTRGETSGFDVRVRTGREIFGRKTERAFEPLPEEPGMFGDELPEYVRRAPGGERYLGSTTQKRLGEEAAPSFELAESTFDYPLRKPLIPGLKLQARGFLRRAGEIGGFGTNTEQLKFIRRQAKGKSPTNELEPSLVSEGVSFVFDPEYAAALTKRASKKSAFERIGEAVEASEPYPYGEGPALSAGGNGGTGQTRVGGGQVQLYRFRESFEPEYVAIGSTLQKTRGSLPFFPVFPIRSERYGSSGKTGFRDVSTLRETLKSKETLGSKSGLRFDVERISSQRDTVGQRSGIRFRESVDVRTGVREKQDVGRRTDTRLRDLTRLAEDVSTRQGTRSRPSLAVTPITATTTRLRTRQRVDAPSIPVFPSGRRFEERRREKPKKEERKRERRLVDLTLEPLATLPEKTFTELRTGRPAYSPSVRTSRKFFRESYGQFVPTAEMLREKKTRKKRG